MEAGEGEKEGEVERLPVSWPGQKEEEGKDHEKLSLPEGGEGAGGGGLTLVSGGLVGWLVLAWLSH